MAEGRSGEAAKDDEGCGENDELVQGSQKYEGDRTTSQGEDGHNYSEESKEVAVGERCPAGSPGNRQRRKSEQEGTEVENQEGDQRKHGQDGGDEGSPGGEPATVHLHRLIGLLPKIGSWMRTGVPQLELSSRIPISNYVSSRPDIHHANGYFCPTGLLTVGHAYLVQEQGGWCAEQTVVADPRSATPHPVCRSDPLTRSGAATGRAGLCHYGLSPVLARLHRIVVDPALVGGRVSTATGPSQTFKADRWVSLGQFMGRYAGTIRA